jgi:hypothetical protein
VPEILSARPPPALLSFVIKHAFHELYARGAGSILLDLEIDLKLKVETLL